MAKKTVLKRLLNNFGVISIDQQSAALATAIQADQAVITEEGFRYIDNEQGEEKIVPFGDVIGMTAIDTTEATDDADTDDNNTDSEEQHD